MNLLKKAASTGAIYLLLVPGVSSVLAATPPPDAGANTNLCPTGSSFGNLCNIVQDPATLIQKFIIIALIVAIFVCLFFLIYGGIRWITSGGDEKQVEAAKSHVVAAIVGLVIALAAWFILQFIGSFFNINILNFKLPTLTATN